MTDSSTKNDRRSLSVVIVPFPFTDLPIWKPRPAVVLSKHPFQEQTGRTVLAMITRGVRTAWPSDVPISELEPAGLPKPSLVRARIGTVENRFIARQIGVLSEADRAAVVSAFREIIVSF
jgi:mRNA interferase MazF